MGHKNLAVSTGWPHYRGRFKFNFLSQPEWQMHHTSHSHFLNRSRSANVTYGVVVTTVLIKKTTGMSISRYCNCKWNFSLVQFTALFTNMRIRKFKSQLTIAFFAAVNHLNGPLKKHNFTLTDSKSHGLWFVIGGFRSILCVSVFQGSLLVIIITIDGSEKRNCEGGFWTYEFACLWKAQ